MIIITISTVSPVAVYNLNSDNRPLSKKKALKMCGVTSTLRRGYIRTSSKLFHNLKKRP